MGNITSDVGACCSSERMGMTENSLIELEGTFVVCKHSRPGPALQIAFTEWEEIIALSRAFAPGGKLLGLSSTKKIIATLHHQPLRTGDGDEESENDGAYELNVWELHRADRGLLNAKKPSGGGSAAPPPPKSSGPATPKLENSARAFPLSNVQTLEKSPGKTRIVRVVKIAFLDSADPRFIAGAVTYVKSPKGNSGAGVTMHGVKVWRIQPARRTWDEASVMDGWSPRNGNKGAGSPRRPARRELCEVTELKHDQEISAFAALRQFAFVGDILGTIQGFYWENWTDVEWRRVSRNKRSKRQDKGKSATKPPSFTPLKAEARAHGSEQAIVALQCTCGGGRVRLYSAGQDAAGTFTVIIWQVSNTRIDSQQDIIKLVDMSVVTCIALGQTPDVGASWYAPSHGHHKLEASPPSPNSRKSAKTKKDKDEEKRTRGMRPNLPPFLFVAGKKKTAGNVPPGGGNAGGKHVLQKWLVRKDTVPKKRMEFKPSPSPILSIGFGPYNNGPLVTGTEGGNLLIWDSVKGSIQQTLGGPTGPVRDICVEPNAHAWTVSDCESGNGNIMAWRLDGQGVKLGGV